MFSYPKYYPSLFLHLLKFFHPFESAPNFKKLFSNVILSQSLLSLNSTTVIRLMWPRLMLRLTLFCEVRHSEHPFSFLIYREFFQDLPTNIGRTVPVLFLSFYKQKIELH